MPGLPLQPHLRRYQGHNEAKRAKIDEYNRLAHRIVERLNRIIADDPSPGQQHLYGHLAAEFGVEQSIVAEAVGIGGSNGITLRVDEEDRRRLKPYEGKS